ncbi:acetyl-CoA carboxylase biotin carboxyl carrier protein subunit [Lederbergia wuyishanensis]|uniref:Acetyl-CoA carboxylase biotin carboxyl carrier protein n=1 Tax=Lederbergia wuyishanensis TaxID=1347903 RepID=A0ABU0CZH9_9BACI|nr:acetyl-CoA carboxylase biotin carboxyl carrier protein subunit [Lederbergia wuyishanensis]MCJ8006165.1 acetyl-CoA carboxylase biotin carboxyl carrier protein subunit [Lederbergia wuyishanensis]MDQ0341535.1 acetyl-CoA carboxylase biotin carboxyl carrier protein [Lederbergia wuyishanensis]
MKTIESPITGIVLRVDSTVGEEILAGEVVIVLESMKMEIPIEMMERGKILEIKVNPDDFINEGDVLLIYET